MALVITAIYLTIHQQFKTERSRYWSITTLKGLHMEF